MERIFIIAGNAAQAKGWTRSKDIDPRRLIYVFKEDLLRGCPRGSKFVRIGTWWEHDRIKQVEQILAERNMQEISPINTMLVENKKPLDQGS